MGRRKETERVYIHTSLSQPMYDRMHHWLSNGESGKMPPGAMRDFIEYAVELFFHEIDKEGIKEDAP